MSCASPAIEFFTTNDLAKCKCTMDSLRERGDPIAVDAEGVNLGATGRLTLLQICDWTGQVYITDVINEAYPRKRNKGKELMIKGGIKDLLEDENTVKVHDYI